MRCRNADEGFGCRFRQTRLELFYTEARVDHHRHDTRLEKGEGQGKKFQAGLDHEHRAHTA